MANPSDPRYLLGLSPIADALSEYLLELSKLASIEDGLSAEVKSYPDALYINYYRLGLSLMFVAKDGSKSIEENDAKGDKLKLDTIDIYNVDDRKEEARMSAGGSSASSIAKSFSSHPVALALPLRSTSEDRAADRPLDLNLSPASTGKDIVACLGEPERKGGGAGPSSGSIGIWCDWAREGIMIEFGGDLARGPQAWERGKDAKWKILTLFHPKSAE